MGVYSGVQFVVHMTVWNIISDELEYCVFPRVRTEPKLLLSIVLSPGDHKARMLGVAMERDVVLCEYVMQLKL